MAKAIKFATIAFTSFVLLVLLALSVRGLIDAQAAAASFGVPITDKAAELYQYVYRSRNLVIAATGMLFLLAAMWRPLAILTTAAVFLPLYDIAVLRATDTAVSIVHPITLIALVVTAALLWTQVRLSEETPSQS